jgi:phosphoglycerate dehydrogenase-like enzyme
MHPAYRLSEAFGRWNTGIRHFQTWSLDEGMARIGETDVLVVAVPLWRKALAEKGQRLRYIQICAAGYDPFDLEDLRARGIRVCNAKGVNANAVREHAFALMLSLTRKLHLARDNQHTRKWRPIVGDLAHREQELAGKTLLVVGLGRIGTGIARLAKAFEMSVIGVRRDATAAKAAEVDEQHGLAALPALLPRADFVVLACPLTDDTCNLIDAAAFARMKPDAALINVARGGCVDEAAMIGALAEGRIAGAGLDTVASEPLAAESPLWTMENVVLTPHHGGETQVFEERICDIVLENLARLWRGEAQLTHQLV